MVIKDLDFFAQFTLWTLKDRKIASWGQIWMEPKYWETSNPFWVEFTINGVNIIINNYGWLKKTNLFKKDNFWTIKNISFCLFIGEDFRTFTFY